MLESIVILIIITSVLAEGFTSRKGVGGVAGGVRAFTLAAAAQMCLSAP